MGLLYNLLIDAGGNILTYYIVKLGKYENMCYYLKPVIDVIGSTNQL